MENNDKDPKYKVCDYVKISKYKNFFTKDIVRIGVTNVFRLKKLKILFLGHMLLVMLMAKKLLRHFTKKNCKRQIKKSLELKSNQKKR